MDNVTNNQIIVQKELQTTFKDDSGSYGNLFDIVAHRYLNITSLDVHCQRSGVVEVWTRPGSFVGHHTSSDGWRLISNTTVEGKWSKPAAITPSEFESVPMNASSTQAFFVRMIEPNLRYSIVSLEVGYPYVDSDDLDLLVGSGYYNYSFGAWELKSRLWNGVVHYSVNEQNFQVNDYNSLILSDFQGRSDDDDVLKLYESNGNIFEVSILLFIVYMLLLKRK